tara:strand:+ start:68 stop:982 length:915 start_codon:yes stop_codon:yes gene_type:complete
MKNELNLYLDWTPNVNHIGFFVAKELGFYKDLEIRVNILDPSADNYIVTPAKKVELGESDFALCPFESVISYRTKDKPFDLTAIAAILQKDLSAIAVIDSRIKSPRYLDNKTYASYGARYEDLIVKQMIINDGGKGTVDFKYPEKLGIWETLVSKKQDSTWIFLNWEGIEAKNKNISLNYFKMRDFKIPYSYSPVIVGSEKFCNEHQELVKKFLVATKKGFLFSISNKNEAVDILSKFIPGHESELNLEDALEETIKALLDNNTWGKIRESNINKFVNWLKENEIVESNLSIKHLFTNSFIPSN